MYLISGTTTWTFSSASCSITVRGGSSSSTEHRSDSFFKAKIGQFELCIQALHAELPTSHAKLTVGISTSGAVLLSLSAVVSAGFLSISVACSIVTFQKRSLLICAVCRRPAAPTFGNNREQSQRYHKSKNELRFPHRKQYFRYRIDHCGGAYQVAA